MPAKNSIKTYAENTVYHVYNRGVEKRNIFLDDQDYHVFLNYLKEYLSPQSSEIHTKVVYAKGRTFSVICRLPKNYSDQIDLLAYCLMSNHFHFIIQQKNNKYAIQEFIQSLLTRYSMYFNKKYNRVGSLFQGKYKAIIVMNETYLLHLSCYIHINPYEYSQDLVNAYSSYADYLGLRNTPWIKPDLILSYFQNSQDSPDYKKMVTYKNFVENYLIDKKDILDELKLE